MRGWSSKSWWLVPGAVALAGACTVGAAATAAAATFTFTFGSGTPIPTSPFHVAVGDVITLTLPPAPPAPSGFHYNGSGTLSATSSDGAVLAPAGAGTEADGSGFASFKAAHSGTAKVSFDEASACPVPNTSTTPTPTASPAQTPQAAVCSASGGSFTVIVDAAVQGVSTTVPATGASGGFGAGLWLVVAGAAASCAALIRVRPARHHRVR